MAYQIPQQLEYKEQIIFGLTLRQVIYAIIFGLLAFIKRALKKLGKGVLSELRLCGVAVLQSCG